MVSDNYLEPFLFNPTGIVIANFFFHIELLKSSNPYRQALEKVSFKEIKLITSIFGMPYIRKIPGFQEFPLIGESFEQLPHKNYFIISKGMGCWSKDFNSLLLDFINNNLRGFKGEIFLDPVLSEQEEAIKDLGLRVKISPFNRKLISKALGLIGRPSVGILTDAMQLRIPFIPIIGEDDLESKSNKESLMELYLSKGIDCNIEDIIKSRELLKYVDLPLGGQKDIAKLISRNLKV